MWPSGRETTGRGARPAGLEGRLGSGSAAEQHSLSGRALINAAATHGYTQAFIVASVLMGVTLLISLVTIRVPKGPGVSVAAEEAMAGIG